MCHDFIMKKAIIIFLLSTQFAFALNFTECKEGEEYPADESSFDRYQYSTHVGFLWWYKRDESGELSLLSKPLDEISVILISEIIENTTRTRVYAKRVLQFMNIMNSYYRDGDFVRIPVTPPEEFLSSRMFSCIDYSF